jgi:hypothetical protein
MRSSRRVDSALANSAARGVRVHMLSSDAPSESWLPLLGPTRAWRMSIASDALVTARTSHQPMAPVVVAPRAGMVAGGCGPRRSALGCPCGGRRWRRHAPTSIAYSAALLRHTMVEHADAPKRKGSPPCRNCCVALARRIDPAADTLVRR